MRDTLACPLHALVMRHLVMPLEKQGPPFGACLQQNPLKMRQVVDIVIGMVSSAVEGSHFVPEGCDLFGRENHIRVVTVKEVGASFSVRRHPKRTPPRKQREKRTYSSLLLQFRSVAEGVRPIEFEF